LKKGTLFIVLSLVLLCVCIHVQYMCLDLWSIPYEVHSAQADVE
jgi:hypothetical protein